MIYSYTQISQYLRCPRQYRYRYMDGWQEKDTRASMLFGRCFEKALGAYFQGEDCVAALFNEWSVYQDSDLDYGKSDSWDKMLHQGMQLLHLFVQENRVSVSRPLQDLQMKISRSLPNSNEFVSYVDAIGEIDGRPYLIDWKTTTSRFADEPEGLWALDPQLICYSWMSGIRDVAMVVFVRKKLPEIQYLKSTITDEQQKEYSYLVEATIGQIESGLFPSHSGIRFPMNACTSCAHLGLCLKNQELIDSTLIRRPGASDLDWLDQLAD